MGFFVNALPLRLRVDPERSFLELLRRRAHRDRRGVRRPGRAVRAPGARARHQARREPVPDLPGVLLVPGRAPAPAALGQPRAPQPAGVPARRRRRTWRCGSSTAPTAWSAASTTTPTSSSRRPPSSLARAAILALAEAIAAIRTAPVRRAARGHRRASARSSSRGTRPSARSPPDATLTALLAPLARHGGRASRSGYRGATVTYAELGGAARSRRGRARGARRRARRRRRRCSSSGRRRCSRRCSARSPPARPTCRSTRRSRAIAPAFMLDDAGAQAGASRT